MHELALAQSIVETAARGAREAGARAVSSVRLRVGLLAGVEAGALAFCFEVAARGTLLAGARLDVVSLPLAIWCPVCEREVELAGVQSLRCPLCGTLGGSLRRGRELEIESVEVED